MSHAFTKNHLHVVFSTKERRKSIANEVQPELWSYMAGICKNQKMVPVAINGIENHVHLLFHLPATMNLSKAINLLKVNSSGWMNENGRNFNWQEGYGAFSVSESNLGKVVQYIRNQKIHHKRMTFEDEFLGLLKKHKMDFDPKYVFG
jgi:REP element-mobilizing transposase RayT